MIIPCYTNFMKPKTLFLLTVVLVVIALGTGLILMRPKSQTANKPIDLSGVKREIKPSETFIEYTDPSGFSFSYPDNLSIEKKEEADTNDYADLQLFSKDVSGSLSLRIMDTKIKTLNDWVKEASVSGTQTEKKLGNLKALEVKTNDRIMLAALDQGILFNIEVPAIEQEFWMKVYEKVLKDFTFVAANTDSTAGVSNYSAEEVIFEGEEVVE